MIRKEDVADLRAGDVVEYGGHPDLHGATLRGPLHLAAGDLLIADYVIRRDSGEPSTYHAGNLTLTVISRAPRPLYINHDREAPVPCDVVRSADPEDGDNPSLWMCIPTPKAMEGAGLWVTVTGDREIARHHRAELPDRLRLLVDGETGQVVP